MPCQCKSIASELALSFYRCSRDGLVERAQIVRKEAERIPVSYRKVGKDLGSGESGGTIRIVTFKKRKDRKLRIIILLDFRL